MFTAITIFQLEEQGKLSLDHAISPYLSNEITQTLVVDSLDGEDSVDYSQVTIAQVLNHTSGLGEHLNSNDDAAQIAFFTTQENDFSIDDIIDLSKKNHDVYYFKSGSKFQYSNLGYILSGEIIEFVTGESYKRVIEKQIFTPLKLQHSFFLSDNIKNAPIGYMDNHPITMPGSCARAAGEIISCVEYLSLFIHNVFTGKLLDNTSQTLILDSIANSISEEMHYGYGFYKENDMIGHSGGTFGFSTKVLISCDLKTYYISSINEAKIKNDVKDLLKHRCFHNTDKLTWQTNNK